MKLAAQNRRSALVLILIAVLLLFTVVGFAAGDASAEDGNTADSVYCYYDPEDNKTDEDYWISFDGKGTFEWCEDGEKISGTYKLTGKTLTFFGDDDSWTCTVENKKLVFEYSYEDEDELGNPITETYSEEYRWKSGPVLGLSNGGDGGASAAKNGMASIRGYIKDAIAQLKKANYIGEAFTSMFDALWSIKEYWWIIIGVLALIECFFGYRLFRVELAIGGFAVGFVGGLLLYPELVKLIPAMEDVPVIQIVVAAILGVAGLLLTQFFFKAAVVIGVGYAGYLFSGPYLVEYQNEMLFRILIGVGAAILAFLLLKILIVLATGLIGGVVALVQLTSLISAVQTPLLEEYEIIDKIFGETAKLGLGVNALTVAFIIGVVIGLFGAIFQFANTSRRRI